MTNASNERKFKALHKQELVTVFPVKQIRVLSQPVITWLVSGKFPWKTPTNSTFDVRFCFFDELEEDLGFLLQPGINWTCDTSARTLSLSKTAGICSWYSIISRNTIYPMNTTREQLFHSVRRKLWFTKIPFESSLRRFQSRSNRPFQTLQLYCSFEFSSLVAMVA